MRILMLLDCSFPPDPRVNNQIDFLLNANHSIVLLCKKDKEQKGIEEVGNLKIIRKNEPAIVYKSKVGALKFPIYYWSWKLFISKNRKVIGDFDAIHAHDLLMAPVGEWLKEKRRKPLLIDLHENYPYLIRDASHTQSKIGKWLANFEGWLKYEKSAVQSAEAVLTVVKEMKTRVEKLGAKNVLVYQNVPNDQELSSFNFKDTMVNNTKFRMVYAGGITPARGLRTVVEAIALMKTETKSRFEFVICGSGSGLDDLKNSTEKLDISEQVKFLGWMTQNEVYAEINQANVTIIPHYKSVQNDCSSPNKLFQYMFLGKPVLVSSCDSIQRLVEEEECGLSYSDKSPEELLIALKKLMNDQSYANKLGENGKLAVTNTFNVKKESKELIEYYNILQ